MTRRSYYPALILHTQVRITVSYGGSKASKQLHWGISLTLEVVLSFHYYWKLQFLLIATIAVDKEKAPFSYHSHIDITIVIQFRWSTRGDPNGTISLEKLSESWDILDSVLSTGIALKSYCKEISSIRSGVSLQGSGTKMLTFTRTAFSLSNYNEEDSAR